MKRISDSVAENFLRVDRTRNPVLDQQRRRARCRTKSERIHRKSSIAKAVEESLKSASDHGCSYNFSSPSRKSQPGRRGGITSYQLEAPSKELQPSKKCSYGPSTFAEEAEEPRYLRRGNVTKHALNAPIKRVQPTKVWNDGKSAPRKPLPPPPINSPLVCSKVAVKEKRKKKCVGFDSVVIYEFPLILGENPSVSSGAPTMIDWKCQNVLEMNFEYYEKFYAPSQGKKRHRKELAIPCRERFEILLRAGFGLDEIVNASLTVQRVQNERMETLRSQSWDRFHVLFESAKEGLKFLGSPKLPPIAMSA